MNICNTPMDIDDFFFIVDAATFRRPRDLTPNPTESTPWNPREAREQSVLLAMFALLGLAIAKVPKLQYHLKYSGSRHPGYHPPYPCA